MMSKKTGDQAAFPGGSGRRDFLKGLLAGGMAVALGPPPALFSGGEEKTIRRTLKNGMAFRRLGRTGIEISEISLGASPLPGGDLFYQVMDRGVNYIDTSHNYEGGNSERRIGRLFRDRGRDASFVCTKFHVRGKWDETSIIRSVEGSLRRLETDYVDVLAVHGAENAADLDDERVLAAFARLREQGKFRFTGLSCHANHGPVVAKAVECGHYDVIQLAYNVFDGQPAEKSSAVYGDYLGESGVGRLIELAKTGDVGVIAMKVLKSGGRQQDLARYRTETSTLPQAMIRWALDNPHVDSVVTEIQSFQEMEEDLAAVGSPLGAAERAVLARHVADNRRNYCHACTVCRGVCPAGVDTTSVLRFLAYAETYGKTAAAQRAYGALAPGRSVAACRDCGACEEACLYGLPVRAKLREARDLLARA